MKNIISLLRPQQWIKNLFILIPLFFSGNLMNIEMLQHVLITTLAFCIASSSIYCLNDIIDCDSDKLHPIKKQRPIASGKISKGAGLLISLSLLICSFGIIFIFDETLSAWIYLITYLILNIAYCIYLKHQTLIDVFIIALGFVLRVITGGTVANIWISHWLILTTFLLALFLAIAKRRDDVVIFEKTGESIRKSTIFYNLSFLNTCITIIATITIICYIMYTISPEVVSRFNCNYVYITSFFVLLGILRYIQLTIVGEKSGSPTNVLLYDRFIQVCVCSWIASFAVIIYF